MMVSPIPARRLCQAGRMFRKCVRAMVGLVAAVLLGSTTACSGAAGTAVPMDWTGDPAYQLLNWIPASTSARFEIDLTNASALNLLNSAQATPLPTTGPSGRAPAADFAWTNYTLVMPPCLGDANYGTGWMSLYRQPVRSAVTVWAGGEPTPSSAIGLCAADIDTAGVTEFDKTGTAESVNGVPGFQTEGAWIGYQTNPGRLLYIGRDSSKSLTEATAANMVAGKPVSGSLAQDPDVELTVSALGRTDTAVLGTILLRAPGALGPDSNSIQAAQQAAGKTMPVPSLGGLGWRRTNGLTGDAVFVTVYSTPAAAQTAADVLRALWGLSDTKSAKQFPGARTTVTDRAVVTVVPGVDPHAYDLRTARAMYYPGYSKGER